jgi:DNA-binding transcriptional ArsR family regulator
VEIPDREKLEARLARELGKVNAQIRAEILDALGDPPKIENVPDILWSKADVILRGILSSYLTNIYMDASERQLNQSSIGIDWSLVNSRASDWASIHAGEMAKDINMNSRQAISAAVDAYYRNGLTLGDVEARLSSIFGPVRSEMIAVTEITRAAVQGELQISSQIEKDAGIKMVPIWQTSNDDIVCPVCGPLNKKKASGVTTWESNGKTYGPPPAHPRCRCWINLELPK